MSGITSGVGVFSGIDTRTIISQLLQIEARPRTLVQQRVVSLQSEQTALLDINTRLGALKSAATRFNTGKVFDAASASTTDSTILTATAASGTAPGAYSFVVDRLVSTQQLLSRGVADSATSGLGLTGLTFEPAEGRLDSPVALATLNGGTGVVRGKIVITDSAGTASTVDLSRVDRVDEVLSAINTATSGRVQASVSGDRFVLRSTVAGAGAVTVADASGTLGTAASLGLNTTATGTGAASTLTGNAVATVGRSTALRQINDGLGVSLSNASGTATPDFRITARNGATFDIDIGDIYQTISGTLTRTATPVADLGGVIDRINTQTGGAVTASISPDGRGLRLTDTTGGAGSLTVANLDGRTTATDLGLAGSSPTATLDGRRLSSGLGSVLLRSLRGGQGVSAGDIEITDRNGASYTVSVAANQTVAELQDAFSTVTNGNVTLELDDTGTGLRLRDNTGGGGPLTVSGTPATQLGLAASAVASSTVNGARAQRQFVGLATQLSTLNSGRGIGTGQFTITDSYGVRSTVNIGADLRTVGEVISTINAQAPGVRARINDNGDGLLIEELTRPSGPGTARITIADTSGVVARNLNLVGEAAGTGAANTLNGAYERTVALDATDSLQRIVEKVNAAGVPVSASVINDGVSSQPFRLTLTARNTGEPGRFTVAGVGGDLGFSTLTEGRNSRVFFGSDDPARAVLLSSATNAVTGIISGLTLDVRAPSTKPVTVTVSQDTALIEKTADEFVAAVNNVLSRIDTLSDFDEQTQRRGILLGDATTRSLRAELSGVINGAAQGVGGRFRFLSQVGFSFSQEGTLELDKARLRSALQEDPQAVRDVLAASASSPTTTRRELSPGVFVNETTAGAVTSAGVAERLAAVAERYLNATTGILTRRGETLQRQIDAQNDRIAAFDVRLASRRTVLERQFLAMEEAIGRLQTQSGSLQNIAPIRRS